MVVIPLWKSVQIRAQPLLEKRRTWILVLNCFFVYPLCVPNVLTRLMYFVQVISWRIETSLSNSKLLLFVVKYCHRKKWYTRLLFYIRKKRVINFKGSTLKCLRTYVFSVDGLLCHLRPYFSKSRMKYFSLATPPTLFLGFISSKVKVKGIIRRNVYSPLKLFIDWKPLAVAIQIRAPDYDRSNMKMFLCFFYYYIGFRDRKRANKRWPMQYYKRKIQRFDKLGEWKFQPQAILKTPDILTADPRK